MPAEKRTRYESSIRQRAYEMAVYEGCEDIAEISRELGVNEGTLRRWRSEDGWKNAIEEGGVASFTNIRKNLMLVIHRMSERLVESMVSRDTLPDENIELRIERLTRSLERTAPLGTFLLTKQRFDVISEIKQLCSEGIADGTIDDSDIQHIMKVLKLYTISVKNSNRKGDRLSAV